MGHTGHVWNKAVRAMDWMALRRVVKRMPRRVAAVVDASGQAAGFGKLWALAAAALALTGSRGRRGALQGGAAYLGAVGLANGPAKWATRRRRPRGLAALDLPVGGRVPRTSSFPSAHTAGAFAFATAAGAQQPVAAPALGAAAVAVGLARVRRVRHFPTDVLAGAALGSAIGGTVALVARRRSIGDSGGATDGDGDGRLFDGVDG